MNERFKYEPYEQQTTYTCGVACAKMVYAKLGVTYTEAQLMTELETTTDGTDWEPIFRHFVTRGFRVEIKGPSSWNELKKDLKKGAVLVTMTIDGGDIMSPHFAIVADMTDDLIEFADPALEVKDWPNIMSKDQFLSSWWTKGEDVEDRDLRTSMLIRKPR